jgi:HSP20 family protein
MAEEREKQIARWDPFRELLESWDPFREVGLGPWRLGRVFDEILGERGRAMRPPIDVTETDSSYVVTVEVPGVKKGDLSVELEEGVLTIRGEKKSERDETREKGRRLERFYGAFSRSLSLPADADPEKVAAAFTDGVLRVEVQKKPGTKPKQIAIKG